MAYEKFALNFTSIDQIITNQFTPISVAAHWLIFVPLISLFKLLQTRRFSKFHFKLFSIEFKNIFAKKELSVYIDKKKIYQKSSINEFD